MSYGNNNFTVFDNRVPKGLSELLIGNLTSDTINVNNVISKNVNGTQNPITIIGYTPTAFSTAASGTSHALLTSPSQVAATTGTDTRLLKIPVGAIVSQVVVQSGTTVTSAGSATISVGGFAASAGTITPTITTSMLSGVTLANANAGVLRITLDSSATANPAAGGQTLSSLKTASGSTTDDQFVAVSPAVAAITAGSFKVMITYYMY
jgi:hypothetical protein